VYREMWSPDGEKVAFSSAGEIYTMNVDGTGETQLTNDAYVDQYPAWSPDSSRIAFCRTDGTPVIYVMNADGSGQRQVTASGSISEQPTWSPDGSRVAFTGIRDLYGDGNMWQGILSLTRTAATRFSLL